MIIVDDRLSIEVLAGRRPDLGPVATTWCFHFRLLRALADSSVIGSLSRAAAVTLRQSAAAPPTDQLTILDPRVITASAAEMAARHGLNLVAAELVAWAVRRDADVHLHPTNVGRAWPDVFAAEGVRLTVA